MVKKKLLSRIFGHVREDVTGDWKELCREELHDWYLPDIGR
jgi:hypothetical protein